MILAYSSDNTHKDEKTRLATDKIQKSQSHIKCTICDIIYQMFIIFYIPKRLCEYHLLFLDLRCLQINKISE